MNNKQVRVLLVEDHFLARVALHSVLENRGDISVIGEAGDGRTGLKLFQELMPDVTVMDLRLPQLNGFDAIAAIRALSRTAKIVVLSNYGGSEDIYRALRSGAMAYLSKATSGEELIQAILSVYRGIRYLPRSASDRLAERMPFVDLTPRECEVLTCITRGLSNQDIADELRIAEKTVRVHVSSVLSKMGARDRTQAAVFAIQRGMVHLD
jgi:DNA-binding NarL/FixJ family response regulator